MESDEEQSTAFTSWVKAAAQAFVLSGLVLVAFAIGYVIVEVGQ